MNALTDQMRRLHRWQRMMVLALVLVLASLAGFAVTAGLAAEDLSRRLDSAKSQRTALSESVSSQAAALAEQQRALSEANRRLAQAGEKPVKQPPVPDVEAPFPTAAEIRVAVAAYCSDGRCDGNGPTRPQITAAVAAFCEDGRCRGRVGERGRPGASITGAPGPAGAAGPGPTDAQIATAVAAYCSDGRCRGPAGTDGAKGDRGEKGDKGDPGTARPGTYACPDGEFVRGFTVAADGAVTLMCGSVLPPPVDPPADPPS